jgi:hypothetical protein
VSVFNIITWFLQILIYVARWGMIARMTGQFSLTWDRERKKVDKLKGQEDWKSLTEYWLPIRSLFLRKKRNYFFSWKIDGIISFLKLQFSCLAQTFQFLGIFQFQTFIRLRQIQYEWSVLNGLGTFGTLSNCKLLNFWQKMFLLLTKQTRVLWKGLVGWNGFVALCFLFISFVFFLSLQILFWCLFFVFSCSNICCR